MTFLPTHRRSASTDCAAWGWGTQTASLRASPSAATAGIPRCQRRPTDVNVGMSLSSWVSFCAAAGASGCSASRAEDLSALARDNPKRASDRSSTVRLSVVEATLTRGASRRWVRMPSWMRGFDRAMIARAGYREAQRMRSVPIAVRRSSLPLGKCSPRDNADGYGPPPCP